MVELGIDKKFQGFVVSALIIGVDAFPQRISGMNRYTPEQQERHCQDGGFLPDCRYEQFSSQGDNGQGQHPLKPVFPDLFLVCGKGGCFHFFTDFGGIDHIQIHIAGNGAHISATGQNCHFLQCFLIEPGQDDISGSIFFDPSGFCRNGNTLITSHANAKQLDIGLSGVFRGFYGIGLAGVLSVCDQDNGFLGICFRIKGG